MAYFHRYVETAKVGDDGDAEGLDAAMVGDDDFGHGTHTNGVTTQQAVHLVFGRSFERGSLNAHIYAVLHLDAFLASYLVSQCDELVVVGLVHVGEAGAGGEILAAEGMLGEEIDVVGDDHDVADFEFGVHASGSIADEERLDAQFVHHADGEGHVLHRVAFIEMEAALHGHDVLASQPPEDEFAAMAFDGGNWEVGNVAVGEFVTIRYF